MAVIDSLVAKLSFDFDDKALETFNKGMADASKAIAVVAAGAVAKGTAIFAFTSKIAEQNDELGKTAQIIGITSQALTDLDFVAQLGGSSIESMNSSLENLSKISSEAARGIGSGVEAFGLLGVSTTDALGNIKNADDLLLDVADAVSQLDSQSQKLELLNKLGISSDLLLTLDQGSAAIRAQRKEVEELGFVLDKDATAAAASFNDEMLRVGTVVKGVASSVGTKLMKQITPMIKLFLDWFKANKEIIKQNLTAFFEKLTKIVNTLVNIGVRVYNVINTVAQAFGGWANAIGVVSAALLALNIRILLIPGLILAAGAAIFLLIEDLVAFANGADSQIGALAEKFPIIGKAAEALIDTFKMVRDGWGLIFSDGEAALEGLMLLFQDLGAVIFNHMTGPIQDAINLLNKIPGVDIQNITAVQTGALASFTGGIFGGGPTSTDNSKQVTVNISGGNTEEVKQAVAEALSSEFKTTELNMSTPTRY